MFKNKKAFTLIEVMIALVILSSIALYTTMTIRKSIRIKKNLQRNIDSSSKFRSAINMMERDINLAFHHRDINYEIYKKIKAENEKSDSKSSDSIKTNPSNNESEDNFEDKKGLIDISKYQEPTDKTHFLGDKNFLHFTNKNQIRISLEDKISSQQEVGYFIKKCANRFNPKIQSDCLWRRNSKFIDEKVDEGGSEYVLLENISFFELRYQGDGKDDWVSQWHTDERGDDVTKDNFPNAVELSIATKEDGKNEEKAKVVLAIRFPNNKATEVEKAEADDSTEVDSK